MTRDYIATMYQAGQGDDARRAIRAEIIRENTQEGEEATYEPTTAEIDAVETEYYASRRMYQYGPPEQQMEYVTEHGITAWQDYVAGVKADIPRPE